MPGVAKSFGAGLMTKACGRPTNALSTAVIVEFVAVRPPPGCWTAPEIVDDCTNIVVCVTEHPRRRRQLSSVTVPLRKLADVSIVRFDRCSACPLAGDPTMDAMFAPMPVPRIVTPIVAVNPAYGELPGCTRITSRGAAIARALMICGKPPMPTRCVVCATPVVPSRPTTPPHGVPVHGRSIASRT